MPETIIESILDKRLGRGEYEGKGRIQDIERRIDATKDVEEKIIQLNALIEQIAEEIENKHGDYYNMLARDPEALSKFEELKKLYSTEGRKRLKALDSIKKLIKQLELLKQRFNRKALRIAFIGEERQGKSTFIKTITGLTDKVVPAYSGNSCTGAVSVIHNVDKVIDNNGNERKVKVDVEYYDEATFIQMVNENLRLFFTNGEKKIRRLDDIDGLNLPEGKDLGTADINILAKYEKFKKSVVEQFNEYKDLIGEGTRSYYDEEIIAQHVAQYEEFQNHVGGSVQELTNDGTYVYRRYYYKYVAVKTVDIYTKFEVDTTKKLELVDTIGINSASDSEKVKEEMYRVLREDCDAAIDLYRPNNAGNPQGQYDILNNISTRLRDRETEKWIVYIINRIVNGPKQNIGDVEIYTPTVENHMKGLNPKPVAWIKAIDGNNFQDVKDNLVLPLLGLIADNLDYLDNALIDNTRNISNEAYNECLQLVRKANELTSSSAEFSADTLTLFDEKLFRALLTTFTGAMNEIDLNGYAQKRESRCSELVEAYEEVIDNLDIYVKDEDIILKQFQQGALLTPRGVFEEHIEQIRNDIFTAFENVNADVLYPLQEKVKTDLIEILYNEGMMKNLPLPTSFDTPSKEWLQSIIDNYVDEKLYPNLNKALRFILEYQINIEGLVEYEVTKSLYIIDRTHDDFIEFSGKHSENFEAKASSVWQELINRIFPVQKQLRKWIDAFTLIPSHSFYSRVHKFYIKVLTDNGGVEDFRRFYRKNMGIIWSDEINAVGQRQKAFGDWTMRVKSLQDVIISKTFNM